MDAKRMNILVAVNKKYIPQVKTLICSLGTNCAGVIDIYLMHSCLTEREVKKLSIFVKKWCRGKLIEIRLDKGFLANAKLGNHFSVEMYYRIFACEYLPQDLERILWLDADIIVLKDIADFYNCNMDGKCIAACKHREENNDRDVVNKEAIERMGMDTDSLYFNSGVILMDLQKIRDTYNHDKICDLINTYQSKLVYPDQDILNLLYEKKVHFVDNSIYNYQVHFDWYYKNEEAHIKNKVVILHYVGPVKPWEYKTWHFCYRYYWHYYLMHGSKLVYLKYHGMKMAYKGYCSFKNTLERK